MEDNPLEGIPVHNKCVVCLSRPRALLIGYIYLKVIVTCEVNQMSQILHAEWSRPLECTGSSSTQNERLEKTLTRHVRVACR